MKTLELCCDVCGARSRFRGENAREVITTIDFAGWTDKPGGGEGWMPGLCPDCCQEDEEDEP